MTTIQQLVTELGKAVSSVYSIATGGGLFAVIGLVNQLTVFKGVDFGAMLAQLGALDTAGRVSLEQAFENSLSLPAALQSKVQALVNSLEDLIVLVQEAVGLVNQGIALVNKVRAILGV